MAVTLQPPLAVQRAICVAASDFLRALADLGAVEGLDPKPTAHGGISPYTRARLNTALAGFERVLNPRRLGPDHPDLRALGVSSPYGERHLFALAESLGELHTGLDAVFAHWGIRDFWGCASFGFGGQLSPGGRWVAGHRHFDVPRGWPPPVPRRLFDAMTAASEQLRGCIREVEALRDEDRDAPGLDEQFTSADQSSTPERTTEVRGTAMTTSTPGREQAHLTEGPNLPGLDLTGLAEALRHLNGALGRLAEGKRLPGPARLQHGRECLAELCAAAARVRAVFNSLGLAPGHRCHGGGPQALQVRISSAVGKVRHALRRIDRFHAMHVGVPGAAPPAGDRTTDWVREFPPDAALWVRQAAEVFDQDLSRFAAECRPLPEPGPGSAPRQRYTLGDLIRDLEADEHRRARELRRAPLRPGASLNEAMNYMYASSLSAGSAWLPTEAAMPGIGRIELLCDRETGEPGINAAKVRRLRARICEIRGWKVPDPANALDLNTAADILTGAAGPGQSSRRKKLGAKTKDAGDRPRKRADDGAEQLRPAELRSDERPEQSDARLRFLKCGGTYEVSGFGEFGRPVATKGFDDIVALLRSAGKGVSVFVLDGRREGCAEGRQSRSRQPAVDRQSREDLRSAIARVKEEIEEAEAEGNEVELADSRRKLDELTAVWKSSVGLGGKARDLNSEVEKLRPKIASRLATAYRRLRDARLAKVAAHLENSISSEGGAYVYEPGPGGPVWDLGES